MRVTLTLLVLAACQGKAEVVDSPEDTGDPVPRGALRLGFPLEDPAAFDQLVGVDHDPVVYDGGAQQLICTNYDGRSFPWCYDEHDGSDYLLAGGFDAMDAGSVTILAAADGVVETVVDGNYDRCHGELSSFSVSCDGHEQRANRVEIRHEGGYLTSYLHMMKDSLLVEPGQEVRCGEPLGKVGSSGNSSTPHLHFELEDAEGVVIDPYAGAYSQPETWWEEQGAPDGLPGMGCAAAG